MFKKFLKKLHPHVFENNHKIYFPNVQQQDNCNDCGIFAIANAIALFKSYNPQKIIYNASEMRNHLKKILNTNKLEMFPCRNLNINENYENLNSRNESIYNIENINEFTTIELSIQVENNNINNLNEIPSNAKNNENTDHSENTINDLTITETLNEEISQNDTISEKNDSITDEKNIKNTKKNGNKV